MLSAGYPVRLSRAALASYTVCKTVEGRFDSDARVQVPTDGQR
jgi:hypothetical protein